MFVRLEFRSILSEQFKYPCVVYGPRAISQLKIHFPCCRLWFQNI